MPTSVNNQKIIGIAKETVRGTSETAATKYLLVDKSAELNYVKKLIENEKLSGLRANLAPGKGIAEGSGSLPNIWADADDIGELIYSLFGTVSSAEQSVIAVTNSNKYLDFNIGAGELVATVTTGSYVIGTSQATVGSLCKAIYDAIVAAEAVGTYTVTYSRTTKLFTITRSAGTFQLMFKTGTHGSDNTDTHIGTLLGYSDAANLTGALTYTGTTAVQFSMKHSFSELVTPQLPSYTFFVERGSVYKKHALGTVKKLSFVGEADQPIMITADVLFKSEETGVDLSPTWVAPDPLIFKDTTFKIDGSGDSNVRSWKLDIDNGIIAKRSLNQSYDCADILVGDKMKVTGSFVYWFESETQRSKFLAGTAVDIQIVAAGSVVSNSIYKTLDIDMPECYYKAFPFTDQDGILACAVDFEAYYKISETKQCSIDLTNLVASY